MKKTLTLILGTLAAATVFSFAQENDNERPDRERRGPRGGGPGGPGRGAISEEMKKFDTNGDGQLDRAERQAAREAMDKEADTNGDGTVDAEERKAALIKRVTPRFDENKDGKLDEAEQAKLDEFLASMADRRPRGQDRPGARRDGDRPGRPAPNPDRPAAPDKGDAKDKETKDGGQ